MLNTEELTAIRERCEKATPGPWRWLKAETEDYSDKIVDGVGLEVLGATVDICDTPFVSMENDDAELMAHSRADIPALLDTVGELRGLLADIKQKHRTVENGLLELSIWNRITEALK